MGTRPPVDRAIDGIDLTPALRGEELPKRALLWHFPHYRHGPGHDPYSVVREGDWKLIQFYDPKKTELYNLASDLGERKDRSASERAKVSEIQAALSRGLHEFGARMPVLSE